MTNTYSRYLTNLRLTVHFIGYNNQIILQLIHDSAAKHIPLIKNQDSLEIRVDTLLNDLAELLPATLMPYIHKQINSLQFVEPQQDIKPCITALVLADIDAGLANKELSDIAKNLNASVNEIYDELNLKKSNENETI